MIVAVIFLSLIVVYLIYGNYKEKRIFENVKWCVYYDSFHRERPEVRMHYYIFHLQHELSIDEKYRVSVTEVDAINEILLTFRQDVIQEYFNGSYQKNRISFEREFFELVLCDYLRVHQDDTEFRNNITYHKMYYILQIHYLKLNNIVDDSKLGVIWAKATKETIDNMLTK